MKKNSSRTIYHKQDQQHFKNMAGSSEKGKKEQAYPSADLMVFVDFRDRDKPQIQSGSNETTIYLLLLFFVPFLKKMITRRERRGVLMETLVSVK